MLLKQLPHEIVNEYRLNLIYEAYNVVSAKVLCPHFVSATNEAKNAALPPIRVNKVPFGNRDYIVYHIISKTGKKNFGELKSFPEHC